MNKCTCGHDKFQHTFHSEFGTYAKNVFSPCRDYNDYRFGLSDCNCRFYKKHISLSKRFSLFFKSLLKGGENMSKYLLVDSSDECVGLYGSLDEAREVVQDDFDGDEEGMKLYALGQEYDVITPSKKVLFKKVGSKSSDED